MVIKTEFIINQQEADNLGYTEMISGILAGLHYFAKQAKIFFRDINQKDECILGDKKCKIYTRDAFSDEDMLIYESYFKNHPEIDIYILCKIKAGQYSYLGYINKNIVAETRKVQMIGEDSSSASDEIRRIFAEQYSNLNDFIHIEEEDKKEKKEIIKQKYFPLHIHSEYSLCDGFGKLNYIAEQLYEKGFAGGALTDHGTLAGVWEFQKQCLLKNIKPIIGTEFYIILDDKEKRYHLTCFVKNEIGWKNILKLQNLATREYFYYKPNVPFEKLLEYSEGLIITTGCSSSFFSKLIEEGKIDKAEELLLKLKEKFKDDLYVEIQLHTIENNQDNMEVLFNLAQKYNIECILTTDSHYPDKKDKIVHDALKAIGLKKKYGEAGFNDDCFYLMQTQDIEERIKNIQLLWILPHIEKMMANTFKIAEKCNFKIIPGSEQDTLPKAVFSDMSKEEKIKQLCFEGLKKYTKYNYEDPIIKARLDLELERIISKKYTNYFLAVWEMVKWAKENGIFVGPGRGSVGASLVAFALNITECDPIEHDLLFDRFLSVIRSDAPDIDLDYQDDRRQELFKHLMDRYGEKHCAKIVTYSRFHPKGILRDIGRIFNIPGYEINKICSMVIERSGGDARASFSLTDTFAEFTDAKEFMKKYPLASELAMKLEGHIRHRGVHAAAMIISESEISSYVPITKISNVVVTEWEKHLTEEMKLIKFDILGLRNLSIIHDAIDDANIKLPKNFDDAKVYSEIFQKGRMTGIFQLGTVGMQKFASQLNINTFSDLYDATTLFRPSCLHSGQAMVYANRKLGKELITYFHKTLEPITKTTKGVILYQEQIMQIMNQVGGMSWATAEMARKVITKSKGKDAFNKMRLEFVANANRIHNMPIEEAEKLYDVVSTFGSYGFNKAHAVEYSIISYWCAWLKTYYPQFFYKSLLKFETDEKEIKDILLDMKKSNIKIEFPDINKSEFQYSISDNKIYAGLNSILGIGLKTAEKIVKNKPYISFEDFKKRCKVSKKILKGLIISDAFREFNINKKKELLEQECNEDFSDVEIAQLIYENTSLTPNIDICKSFNFGNRDFKTVEELKTLPGGKQYYIRGIVTDVLNKDKLIRHSINEHVHKFERHIIYLNVNDGSGNIACQINPETYEKFGFLLEHIKKQPVIVLGTTTKDGNKMYCDMLQVLSDECKNDAIDKLENDLKKIKSENQAIIMSARPAVSKNKKSYYRIILSNGLEGMCFKFKEKLFPGMKVYFSVYQMPFINLKVIT